MNLKWNDILAGFIVVSVFLAIYGLCHFITARIRSSKKKQDNDQNTEIPVTDDEPRTTPENRIASADRPPEYPDITFRADDGSMHLNVGRLVQLNEESCYHFRDMEDMEKSACRASGLPAEQVQKEIRAWIESHLTQEDLGTVPNGIPVINFYRPEVADFVSSPCDQRFAVADPRRKWEDRYHPFFLEHAPDPEASIRQVLQYMHDLPWFGSKPYLCLKGRVSAGHDDASYLENTDSIRAYNEEHESAHDGANWEKEIFELTCSDEPKTANNEHQAIDFPGCKLAYRDDDSVLLHRPFLLEGWYRLRYIKEGGNGWENSWYWHNIATSESSDSESRF